MAESATKPAVTVWEVTPRVTSILEFVMEGAPLDGREIRARQV